MRSIRLCSPVVGNSKRRVTPACAPHEIPWIPPHPSRPTASKRRVTSGARAASRSPHFLRFPPASSRVPVRKWRVTSAGPSLSRPPAPTRSSPSMRSLPPTARPLLPIRSSPSMTRPRLVELGAAAAALAPQRGLAPDPFAAAPAPAGCDVPGDIRHIHTAAGLSAAAETSTDTGCSASWSTSRPCRTRRAGSFMQATAGPTSAAIARRSDGSVGSTHRREVGPEFTVAYVWLRIVRIR